MAKKHTFKDIDIDFSLSPVDNDITTRTDERAIKFAIKSLILTNYYERLFRSDIGSPINQLLFENMDSNLPIIASKAITDAISNNEPRVDVLDVQVKPSPGNNALYVNINFLIKNTEREFNVGVTLERTR